jgi:hypothetical protein
MATNDFSVMLDECLQLVQAGTSIEDAVQLFPEHAEDLRELLRLTASIQQNGRPRTPVDRVAQAEARRELLRAVAAERAGVADGPALGLVAPLRQLLRGSRRLVLLPQALPAALAVVLLGGAALAAAAVAGDGGVPLPGLGGSSRQERVELRGTILAIDPVAGTVTVRTASGERAVTVTSETEFGDAARQPLSLADFAAGDNIKISAFQRNSTLVAREIEREQGAQPPAPTSAGPAVPATPPASNNDQAGDDRFGPGNADEDRGRDDANGGPGNAEPEDTHDDEAGGPGDDEHPDTSGPGGGEDSEQRGENSGEGNRRGRDGAHEDDSDRGSGGGEDD